MSKMKRPVKESYLDFSDPPYSRRELVCYLRGKMKTASLDSTRFVYHSLLSLFGVMGPEITRKDAESIIKCVIFGSYSGSLNEYAEAVPREESRHSFRTLNKIMGDLEKGPRDWLIKDSLKRQKEREQRQMESSCDWVSSHRMNMQNPHFLELEGTDMFDPDEFE